MALTFLKSEPNVSYFVARFGIDSVQVAQVKDLAIHGVLHTIQSFGLAFVHKGKTVCTVPFVEVAAGENSDGAVNDAQTAFNQILKSALDDLCTTYVSIKSLVAAVAPVQSSAKPQPLNAVISLREAKAVGQRVKGTSSGSVYRCIAVSKNVRIAARIYNGGASVSIRAEWDKLSSFEKSRMIAMDMTLKDNYASVHFPNAGELTHRVIGAFLMDLGITFEQQVTHATELVTE